MWAKDFADRHIGPRGGDIEQMLSTLGLGSLDELISKVIPADIRRDAPLNLPAALSEVEALDRLRTMADANKQFRNYLGMGYHGTITPGVILRNVLENPAWYTAYTPYQAEIAQGRLEALVVFEMMVQDLTGFEISNASLLDEGTAAAEAMTMAKRMVKKNKSETFFVAHDCHPQTISVVKTRAEALGWEVIVGDPSAFDFSAQQVFGALLQYPTTYGDIEDYRDFAAAAHDGGAVVIAATDLLALTLIEPPAAWGADIAIGSTQRFGVPMGFGGPHAAYLASSTKHARKMAGRIIGVSRDSDGKPALRMSLGTREQHIRRAKATSNVCTAQVLLAVIAAMYAVYHGPQGLRRIAETVRGRTAALAAGLKAAGFAVKQDVFFDTIVVHAEAKAHEVMTAAVERGINLRRLQGGDIAINFDETVTEQDVADVLACFGAEPVAVEVAELPQGVARTSDFMTHPVFHRYRSETDMLRYLYRLQSKDLSLTSAMIPLGSCTMKLNATSEMEPVTWPGFANMHPFAPADQVGGYHQLLDELAQWLSEITGFAQVSLQPNAGSQGEYAGLLVIRAFHEAQGNDHRNICIIPTSAHGTNPASAVMAGMKVVEVACDDQGNIDVDDLRAKAEKHADNLGALMVTYPSTHGVFEESIREICQIVHDNGGQVYMDGANLNAMVGLCTPGEIGADVCHLNLHKTFAIPHGGGGPGMGPIGVAAHLAPFLPGHPVVLGVGGEAAIGPISAGPWGSPSILPISWAYIAMLGTSGLERSTKQAILNANYIAKRLEGHFDVLYTGTHGFVAHECILDCRMFKDTAGIEVDDIAKRLMDYGFHGPTMSWPVSGTLMVEPTESESKAEIDRFCDAMIAIRNEIRAIEAGEADREDNVLRNAPHTAFNVTSGDWAHPYSRHQAAYPSEHQLIYKFWPSCSRVDNAWGDKNLTTVLPETF